MQELGDLRRFPFVEPELPSIVRAMMTPRFTRRKFVKLAAATGAGLTASTLSQEQKPAAFELPSLPYGIDDLEPHIDAKTMEIHHGKHHAAYVNNLNAAVDGHAASKGKSLEDLLSSLPSIGDDSTRQAIRNNGGGHWNHDFFWKTLTPAKSSGKPGDDLLKAIDENFGSLDEFKKAFAEAATKRFGSGWAWLINQNGKLKVVSTPNQDNPLMKGIVPDADIGTPLLGLDVWEHAYYLHYQNRRADYIGAWWNVVNWHLVTARFTGA